MKVGLFFGSYNPIHIGHLIIGNFVADQANLDQVWFVISPQSPFKKRSNLANEYDRLRLVELATDGDERLMPSNIEFNLPKPSYTVDTLAYLYDQFPSYDFSLLMGSDNLKSLPKWKNYEVILKNHDIIVYKRTGARKTELDDHPRVTLLDDTPLLNISSTFLRKLIRDGKSIKYLVPDAVEKYIDEMGLFKK